MVSRQRRDQLKYPHKHKARKIASRAIEQGILVRPEICPGCGEKKFVESHHEDYDKPLEVLWRCRQCHIKLHLKPPFTCRICGDITVSSSTSKGTASRKLRLCPKHYKKLRRYGDPEWEKPVLQCPHGHPVPSYCYKCKIARKPDYLPNHRVYCSKRYSQFKRQALLALTSVIHMMQIATGR